MQTVLYVFSILTISQLLFLGLFYLLYIRRHAEVLMPLLLCLCLIGMIVVFMSTITTIPFPVLYVAERFSLATVAVMWVLVSTLFVDNSRVSATMWFVLLSYQVVRAVSALVFDASHPINTIVIQLSSLVILGICIHTVVLAIGGLGDDLVARRRRLRVPFALGMGIIVTTIAGLALLSTFLEPQMSAALILNASAISMVVIFGFTLTTNLSIFSLFLDSSRFIEIVKWGESEQKFPVDPMKSINPQVLERIKIEMEKEKLFRDSGLTISKLAAKISVQEHKLRKIINQGLGYRNFNQFLNYYRIKDTCQRLLNQDDQSSISLIALDVGYASLSSFNKAFKEFTGVTPTYFRNNPKLTSMQLRSE